MDRQIDELHRRAATRPEVIGLAGGLPALDLMPRAELARALAEVAASREALQYGWPEGDARLRTWIASRLATRGADVAPERVIVTAGAQQALAIAGALLATRTIAVGDATYPGALAALAGAGARIVASGGDARYLIEAVSNPHGVAPVDREELLATDGTLIVDEAYVELRFDGRVPRPLLADAPDRVWHVGTISKTISPGLRIGWLVPPPAHHAAALEVKRAADLQTSSVAQAALARLIATLDYDALLARARAVYAARARILVAALRRYLPSLRFAEPEGGMAVWLETEDHGDEIALVRTALEEGVMFDPGSAFRPVARSSLALRLGYATAPPGRLAEGIRRLALALARWRA
jgi:2-aminoadipate transaminase